MTQSKSTKGRGARSAGDNGGRRRAAGSEKNARPQKPAKRSAPPVTKAKAPAARKSTDDRDAATSSISPGADRIAKVMARAGLCSRREAETWIAAGRVEVNGRTLETPAVTVGPADKVLVDGTPLPTRERTRLWLYHKPRGLVTTTKDPEGRPTVFQRLPSDLPRVLSVGRLDINTEGLLLLTNDGGLARVLELPATGWLRRYRVRAFGKVEQKDLDALADGIAIDGVLYGAIEATLDKQQGDNVWMTVGLREGKNREVKRVLEHLGLSVNRLIRVSFGPFQLADLDEGTVREIRGRVLRDQLGEKLAEEAGADFDAPIIHQAKPAEKPAGPSSKRKASGTAAGDAQKRSPGRWLSERDGKALTNKGGKTRRGDSDRSRREGAPGGRGPAEEPRSGQSRGRRIWGEDGLLEDKRQNERTGPAGRSPRADGRSRRTDDGPGKAGPKRPRPGGRG